MQELVVGIPPTWICLMRRVARVVLVYIEAAEAAAAEEDEEACDQGGQGDQDDHGGQDEQGGQYQTQEHFMDYDPIFVHFCIFIQL